MAKFNAGDDTDKRLVGTMVHEFYLCQQSFLLFGDLAAKEILDGLSRAEKVRLYSSYSAFIHHLYEFFISAMQRDRKNTSKIDWKDADALLNLEAQKYLDNTVRRIEGGVRRSSDNDISYYKVKVPANFGQDFRLVRNRTAHALDKRLSPHSTLTDFYRKYHKFIMMLFYFGGAFWVVDEAAYDWGELEKFSVAIHPSGLPS